MKPEIEHIEAAVDGQAPQAPKVGRPTVVTLEQVIEVVEEHDRERRELSIRSVQRACGGSQETVKAMLEKIGRAPLKVEREPDVHEGLVKALVKGIEDHTAGLRQDCQRKIDVANGLVQQEVQKRVRLATDLREAKSALDERQVECGVLQGLLLAERQASRQAAAAAEAERLRADAAEKALTALKQELESLRQSAESCDRARDSVEADLATAEQTVAKLQGELLGVMEAKNVRDHHYHQLSEQNKQLIQMLNQLACDRSPQATLTHPADEIVSGAPMVGSTPLACGDRGEGDSCGEMPPDHVGGRHGDDPF